MLEFDCEVALFQSAFRNIQEKNGQDLLLLGFMEAKKYKHVIRQTYKDIKQIREDEKINSEDASLRDKKLVAGMLASILGHSYQWFDNRRLLCTFVDVYPRIDWGLYFMIVDICNWENHLVQCLDALHIKILLQATKKIFSELSLCSKHSLIPFLLKVTVMLMHPRKMEEFLNTSAFADGSEYKDFIQRLIEVLRTKFGLRSYWSNSLKEKFLLTVLKCMVQSYFYLWSDSLHYPNENCSTVLSTEILKENITLENLELIYMLMQEGTKHLNIKLFEEKIPIDILVLFFEFCYQVLMSDISEELILFTKEQEEESPVPSNILSHELRTALIDCTKCCKKFISLEAENVPEVKDINNILLLINDKIASFFPESLESNISSPDFDIIESIDKRCSNYRGDIAWIIEHPELVYTKDFISCLERNVVLLDNYDANQLLLQIKDRNLKSPNVERIKLIIISSFLKWPKILQQQFLIEYLTSYSKRDILETSSFFVNLTGFFNKFLKKDSTLSLDNAVLNTFWSLCLQSPQKTFFAAISNAAKNESQVDIISELFSSIPILCTYRTNTLEPTFLCQSVKKYLIMHTLTDVQTQNFIIFLKKLLKMNGKGDTKSSFFPILSPLDLFHSCILPFLNKWIPGSSPKLLFAFHLFQDMIDDSSIELYQWLFGIRPYVVLCYMCIAIYQCKLICTADNYEWITVKTQAIAIIQKILNCIFHSPKIITNTELHWLIKKLQAVHEPTLFYLVDLLEFHNYQGNFRGTDDPVSYLLDFGICSEKNAQAVTNWFQQINKGFKKNAWAQVTATLVKVLPFCLLREWRNLVTILKYSFENGGLIPHKELCFIFSHSKESKDTLAMLYMLEKTIILCNALQNNVNHMLHCFTIVVKEQVESFIVIGLEEDDLLLPAEIFIQICHLVKQLSPVYDSDGGVLLLELARLSLRDIKHTRLVVSKLREALCEIPPPFEMYNAINKMLIE